MRGAAALCGTTHKTVKRVIERGQAGEGFDTPKRQLPRNTDVVATVIEEKVRATDGRISAKRLLAVARTAGYTGSARTSAGLWPTWHRRRRVYRPWQPTPGEHLVIDWTNRGRLAGLLRGVALEPVALRGPGPGPEGGHHDEVAGGVLRGDGRRPGGAG